MTLKLAIIGYILRAATAIPPVRIAFFMLVTSFYGIITFSNVVFRIVSTFGGCLRKRTHRKPHCLEQYLDTRWQHKFVQLTSGIRLHYVVDGDESKPLMLFLHGFPEFWYSWRHQLVEFRKNFRVVALDQRGYSESDKPPGIEAYQVNKLVEDVVEFVNKLGYEKVHVVAHDWGGIVAYYLAFKHQNLLNSLTIINAPHPKIAQRLIFSDPKQFLMSWYVFMFRIPRLAELLLSLDDYKFLEIIFKTKAMPLDDGEVEAFKWNFSQPGFAGVNWYRARGRDVQTVEPSAVVRCPHLVVWALDDAFLSEGMLDDLSRHAPKLRVVKIPRCGHFAQQEQPDIVNDAIRSFLSEVQL